MIAYAEGCPSSFSLRTVICGRQSTSDPPPTAVSLPRSHPPQLHCPLCDQSDPSTAQIQSSPPTHLKLFSSFLLFSSGKVQMLDVANKNLWIGRYPTIQPHLSPLTCSTAATKSLLGSSAVPSSLSSLGPEPVTPSPWNAADPNLPNQLPFVFLV